MAVDFGELRALTVTLLTEQFTPEERAALADYLDGLEPIEALELLHGLAEDIAP